MPFFLSLHSWLAHVFFCLIGNRARKKTAKLTLCLCVCFVLCSFVRCEMDIFNEIVREFSFCVGYLLAKMWSFVNVFAAMPNKYTTGVHSKELLCIRIYCLQWTSCKFAGQANKTHAQQQRHFMNADALHIVNVVSDRKFQKFFPEKYLEYFSLLHIQRERAGNRLTTKCHAVLRLSYIHAEHNCTKRNDLLGMIQHNFRHFLLFLSHSLFRHCVQ